MTSTLSPTDALSIAAAALLARAIARYSATGTALSAADIPMPESFLRDRLGAGAATVTADQAWDELLDRGLIAGTRQSWTPTGKGARHGA